MEKAEEQAEANAPHAGQEDGQRPPHGTGANGEPPTTKAQREQQEKGKEPVNIKNTTNEKFSPFGQLCYINVDLIK